MKKNKEVNQVNSKANRTDFHIESHRAIFLFVIQFKSHTSLHRSFLNDKNNY